MGEPADVVSPALENLLTRYRGMVLRVGERHGLGPAEVDDVLQDVRIRLWRALATGERIAGVNASYVYRTAGAAALDMIRRRRARKDEATDLSTVTGPPSHDRSPGPDRVVENAELEETIAQTVDTLMESRRAVVRMYLQGYSATEIGNLLGWSEAKARNLLSRGLAELRTKLTAQGIHPEATS